MGGRGRGRGRGRGMSFDVSALGITPGEPLPAPILQPPPTYPPLDHQPVPMQSTPEMDYMIALKKDFVVYCNNSFCVLDKRDAIKGNPFDWRFLPAEIMPKKKVVRKRTGASLSGAAKKTNFDLSLLDELAKQEENLDEPEIEQEPENEEKREGEEEEEQNEEGEEEEQDEEMDDGTDYVNNYFDNGEGFDDDDDNGNDGPIY